MLVSPTTAARRLETLPPNRYGLRELVAFDDCPGRRWTLQHLDPGWLQEAEALGRLREAVAAASGQPAPGPDWLGVRACLEPGARPWVAWEFQSAINLALVQFDMDNVKLAGLERLLRKVAQALVAAPFPSHAVSLALDQVQLVFATPGMSASILSSLPSAGEWGEFDVRLLPLCLEEVLAKHLLGQPPADRERRLLWLRKPVVARFAGFIYAVISSRIYEEGCPRSEAYDAARLDRDAAAVLWDAIQEKGKLVDPSASPLEFLDVLLKKRPAGQLAANPFAWRRSDQQPSLSIDLSAEAETNPEIRKLLDEARQAEEERAKADELHRQIIEDAKKRAREAKKRAQDEAARRAEEERQRAEQEAAQRAEEERQRAEEERRQAEEEHLRVEQERQRAEAEAARARAAAEAAAAAARIAEEEAARARTAAEQEAYQRQQAEQQRRAAEAARQAAAEQRKAAERAEAERARLAAEQAAAEEDARLAAEQAARQRAAADQQRHVAAEAARREQEQRQASAAAAAQAKAEQEASARAAAQAEAEARRQAEDQQRRAAEAARAQAAAKAKQDAARKKAARAKAPRKPLKLGPILAVLAVVAGLAGSTVFLLQAIGKGDQGGGGGGPPPPPPDHMVRALDATLPVATRADAFVAAAATATPPVDIAAWESLAGGLATALRAGAAADQARLPGLLTSLLAVASDPDARDRFSTVAANHIPDSAGRAALLAAWLARPASTAARAAALDHAAKLEFAPALAERARERLAGEPAAAIADLETALRVWENGSAWCPPDPAAAARTLDVLGRDRLRPLLAAQPADPPRPRLLAALGPGTAGPGVTDPPPPPPDPPPPPPPPPAGDERLKRVLAARTSADLRRELDDALNTLPYAEVGTFLGDCLKSLPADLRGAAIDWIAEALRPREVRALLEPYASQNASAAFQLARQESVWTAEAAGLVTAAKLGHPEAPAVLARLLDANWPAVNRNLVQPLASAGVEGRPTPEEVVAASKDPALATLLAGKHPESAAALAKLLRGALNNSLQMATVDQLKPAFLAALEAAGFDLAARAPAPALLARAGYPGKTPDGELAGTYLGWNLLEIRCLINEVTRLPAAERGPAARARDPRFQEALGNIRQTRAAPVVQSNYAKLVEPSVSAWNGFLAQ
jgi:hypothetical protein